MSASDMKRATELPRLRRALEQRYPGVSVHHCELRVYSDGREGCTVEFRAETAEVLIRHGLARREARNTRKLVAIGGPEVGGDGFEPDGSFAWVIHHIYDGVPDMPGSRTYPPKYIVAEFERLMRRMRRSKRPIQPEPGL